MYHNHNHLLISVHQIHDQPDFWYSKRMRNYIPESAVCLKEGMEKAGSRGIAFDLDETLVNTNLKWFKYLSEIIGNPEGLSPEELVKKYRYVNFVPYFFTPEAIKVINQLIDTDEFQRDIPPTEGSLEAVKEISLLVPIVAYITARPECVRSGTEYWIKENGFPEAPVILRQNEIPFEERHPWKAAVLEYMYPQVRGIVDDNPGVVSALSPDYGGKVFLFEEKESPVESGFCVPCMTWKDVVSGIKGEFAMKAEARKTAAA